MREQHNKVTSKLFSLKFTYNQYLKTSDFVEPTYIVLAG